jgi:hypothetical protein
VIPFILDNAAIEEMPASAWPSIAVNSRVRDQLRRLFAEQRPNVAHFHNTFP